MAGTIFRSLLNINTSLSSLCISSAPNLRTFHTAPVCYAARKGTRAKARAKKVKVEVTKVGFIPHNQRKKKIEQVHINKHLDDTFKQISKDNVYPMRYYQWPRYTAEEAVKAHQETHHPTMYNVPDALVYAHVELNMTAIKKNRYIDNFTRLALLPHGFPRDEERSIMVLCKSQDLVQKAIEAGAAIGGSTEIIKKIQDGEIKLSDYDYVIAHPNILTDLVPIRGLLKRKYPNIRAGTLDPDVPGLVKKFANGVQCVAQKDENQQDFACISVTVGRLNMDPKLVAENIGALIKDIQTARPKRPGLFITRCFVTSPPSKEKLRIDPFVYTERTLSTDDQDDSDDEDERVSAKA